MLCDRPPGFWQFPGTENFQFTIENFLSMLTDFIVLKKVQKTYSGGLLAWCGDNFGGLAEEQG